MTQQEIDPAEAYAKARAEEAIYQNDDKPEIKQEIKNDSAFSKFLMLPFRIFYPPILNTPISTVQLPSVFFTMPLVFISFFFSVGGFVYCYVNHSSFYSQYQDEHGKAHTQWYRNQLMDEVVFEAIIVGLAYSSISCIAICAYYALSNKKPKSFSYKMLYRFGCTFPIWVLLGYQMFHLKIPQYFPRFTL